MDILLTAEESRAAAEVQNTIHFLSRFIQAMEHEATWTACVPPLATEKAVQHFADLAILGRCLLHEYMQRGSSAFFRWIESEHPVVRQIGGAMIASDYGIIIP